MGMFKDCGCGCKGKNQQKKFLTSAVAGLLFFIVANPETFMIVRKLLGNWVANQYGTPTMYGLLFHAFVFMMITWAMMNIGRSRENADGSEGPPPPPIPGSDPVPNDTTLPPVPDMSQPIMDTPAIPSASSNVQTDDSSSMSYMNTIFGGGNSGSDLNIDQVSEAPLSGSNWTSCSCKNGTQVMVLSS